jgi:RNA polymerase sigma-70 factor (ECF subfamily)
MRLQPSPIVALNRAVAIALRSGPANALAEIRAMRDRDRLSGYPFYFAALGELEYQSGNAELARTHFRQALSLARNPMERRFYARRLAACDTDAASFQGLEGIWDRAFET